MENSETLEVAIGMSCFYLLVGVGGPLVCMMINDTYTRKQTQMAIFLMATWTWLFWFCIYMAQMNPLKGPELKTKPAQSIWLFWQDKKAIDGNVTLLESSNWLWNHLTSSEVEDTSDAYEYGPSI